MKKKAAIPILFLIILMILGCKWTIPQGLEVKGRLGIKNLTLDFNLSEEISKAIKDNINIDGEGDYTVTVQECINVPDVFTLLVHLDIPIDDFETPQVDPTVDIIPKIDDWFENDYVEYDGSGDVNTFIDGQLDKMEEDLGDKKVFEWGDPPQQINVPQGWNDDLKVKVKQAVEAEGTADPDRINEIIEETVKEEAAELILASPVTVGEDDSSIVEEDLDPFTIGRMDISDFIDFEKIELDGFISMFYFSVSDKNTGEVSNFLNDVQIHMKLGNETIFNYEPIITYQSNIDTAKDEFTGAAAPQGMEASFEKIANSLFLYDNDEVPAEIKIRVEDKEFPLSDFTKEYDLKVELVIWLPLSFKVKTTVTDGYNFKLPVDFKNDLFDRDDPDSLDLEEYIKGAGIELVFSDNIFPNTKLVIDNANGRTPDDDIFYKPIDIKSSSLKLDFNSSDIKKLNNSANFPFTPEISILIGSGGGIKIPKELNLEKFSMYADIDYKMEF